MTVARLARGKSTLFGDELQKLQSVRSEKSKGQTMVMELVYDALFLMLIGMGAVFAFLFILVLSVQLMSRWLPKPVVAPVTSPVYSVDTAVPATVVAAISAAIHQFRQPQKSPQHDLDKN